MRNPFRRRRRLPGAASDWDESQHVSLAGGRYVAIPQDELPAETVERLAGVTLYDTDQGSAVLVNVTAVQAEVEEKSADLADETIARTIERAPVGDLDDPEFRARVELAVDAEMQRREYQDRLQEIINEAFNNRQHWVMGGIEEMVEDGSEYSFIYIDLLSGRVGGQERTAYSDEQKAAEMVAAAIDEAVDEGWGPRLAEIWQSLPADYAAEVEGIEHSSDPAYSAFLKAYLSGRTLRLIEVDRHQAPPVPDDLADQARRLDPFTEAMQTISAIQVARERIGDELFGFGPGTWGRLREWAIASEQEEFGESLLADTAAAFEFGYVMRCFEEARGD